MTCQFQAVSIPPASSEPVQAPLLTTDDAATGEAQDLSDDASLPLYSQLALVDRIILDQRWTDFTAVLWRMGFDGDTGSTGPSVLATGLTGRSSILRPRKPAAARPQSNRFTAGLI